MGKQMQCIITFVFFKRTILEKTTVTTPLITAPYSQTVTVTLGKTYSPISDYIVGLSVVSTTGTLNPTFLGNELKLANSNQIVLTISNASNGSGTATIDLYVFRA